MEQFSQHINFYFDEFKKQTTFFSVKHMVIVFSVCLLLFVVVSVVQIIMINQLKSSANLALTQKNTISDQLENIKANFVEPKEDPLLKHKIKEINERISNKQKLVGFLDSQSSKKRFSFSSVMMSLSEKTVGGIWLTALSIETDGSQYRLEGNSQQPDLLPRYIDELKTSNVLKVTSFNLFDLERVEKGRGYLKFILSSEGDASESEVTLR